MVLEVERSPNGLTMNDFELGEILDKLLAEMERIARLEWRVPTRDELLMTLEELGVKIVPIEGTDLPK